MSTLSVKGRSRRAHLSAQVVIDHHLCLLYEGGRAQLHCRKGPPLQPMCPREMEPQNQVTLNVRNSTYHSNNAATRCWSRLPLHKQAPQPQTESGLQGWGVHPNTALHMLYVSAYRAKVGPHVFFPGILKHFPSTTGTTKFCEADCVDRMQKSTMMTLPALSSQERTPGIVDNIS